MTDVTVKVYLNQDGLFWSYAPGDRLVEVLKFDSPMPACGSVD